MSGSPPAGPDEGTGGYWERLRDAPPPPPPQAPPGMTYEPSPASPPSMPPPSYPPPRDQYSASKRNVTGFTPAMGVTAASAVLMMIGSIGPWVTVSFAGLSISAGGTNPGISRVIGINGWLTFIAAAALLVLVFTRVAMSERSVADFAPLVAFVGLGLAVYDMARVAYGLSGTRLPRGFLRFFGSEHVGWGLVLLLIGAIGAMAGTVAQARAN